MRGLAGPAAAAAGVGPRPAAPPAPARAAAGLRLFVAVPLPPGPAAHLAAALGREADPRWHLTLAFLGEQPSAAPYADALAALPVEPFRLALAGGGTFGGRVLWVDVGEGRRELVALAERVQAAVRGAGAVLEERPYRPHLTVRRGRDLDAGPLGSYAGPAFDVDRVVLFESRDGRHLPVGRQPSSRGTGPGQEG